jgi:very-short-patch-repair endonuclease
MNFATPQAKKLYYALKARDVYCILEFWDGKKHVDIGLPDAKICIEVDGAQHYDNPEQILRDFKREHWSDEDGFSTLHIPNEKIDQEAEKIAEAIAKVAKANRK